MSILSRRNVLKGMGIAAGAAMLPACFGGDDEGEATAADEAELKGDASFMKGVDTIVVLMMENRSFDHVLGSLAMDKSYAGRNDIDGLKGVETNPDANGKLVKVYRGDTTVELNHSHDWDFFTQKINGGKMDGFVKTSSTAQPSQVMAYHDRSQLPITHWLADNFTVCDRWFTSCLGNTQANRRYLHSCTTRGIKDGTGFGVRNIPHTVMDRLDGKGVKQHNYYFGRIAQYAATYYTRLPFNNPTRKIESFFKDAKEGDLPPYSVIDPDFESSDDHPIHDLKRGQVFIGTVMKALMASPQWKSMLVVLTYDEAGGFYDHVAPPKCQDDQRGFDQLSCRVPAIVMGPMVKAGAVNHTVFEHSSLGATLGKRYGLEPLSKRMATATTLASVISPELVARPRATPTNMPMLVLPKTPTLTHHMGANCSSSPELADFARSGKVPEESIDPRDAEERTAAWMRYAQEYEVVKLV